MPDILRFTLDYLCIIYVIFTRIFFIIDNTNNVNYHKLNQNCAISFKDDMDYLHIAYVMFARIFFMLTIQAM